MSLQDVVVMTHCDILSTADILGGLSHYLCESEASGGKGVRLPDNRQAGVVVYTTHTVYGVWSWLWLW